MKAIGQEIQEGNHFIANLALEGFLVSKHQVILVRRNAPVPHFCGNEHHFAQREKIALNCPVACWGGYERADLLDTGQ